MDAALVDGCQSAFRVEERPFEAVGADLDVDAGEALDRVRRLVDEGIVRRFGPVFNPPVIGSSTLAAVTAPEERFDEVAAIVNGYRQVNHNYARDHEWNMWFVVTAGSRDRRDAILAEIEERTGLDALNLPMLPDSYIDLAHPVGNDDRFAREGLDEPASDCLPYDHERLYSTETLEQTGARYEALVGVGDDGVEGDENANDEPGIDGAGVTGFTTEE